MIKSIMFNSDEVRAIIDGRKTSARKIIRGVTNKKILSDKSDIKNVQFAPHKHTNGIKLTHEKPPCEVGSIIYVRESFTVKKVDGKNVYFYRADYDDDRQITNIWTSPMYMKATECRIWLRVTNIKIQKLREILPCEVLVEGLHFSKECTDKEKIAEFAKSWDKLVKKSDRPLYGWSANPWVWVIEFEMFKMN